MLGMLRTLARALRVLRMLAYAVCVLMYACACECECVCVCVFRMLLRTRRMRVHVAHVCACCACYALERVTFGVRRAPCALHTRSAHARALFLHMLRTRLCTNVR